MLQKCRQHQNKIERICLTQQCSSRALCLLCEHQHSSNFQSIMQKKSQNYKTFSSIINASIDDYFLINQDSSENQVKKEQMKLIRNYFKVIKKELEKLVEEVEDTTIQMLNSEEYQNFQIIKKARIKKDYVNVPTHIFQILSQVYEGGSFKSIFKSNQSVKVDESYEHMAALNDFLKKLFQSVNLRFAGKVPDIRKINLGSNDQQGIQMQSYDNQLQTTKKKYKIRCINESKTQFNSIISDSLKIKSDLLTISYDKMLRIFDQKLQLIKQFQYDNILTKISNIGEDIYAIAKSKEIMIDKIQPEGKKDYQRKSIMKLVDHHQRISDIDYLNTRIIGSSSTEGVKIWDLYKEKCQYTFRDDSSPSSICFMKKTANIAIGFSNHFLKIFTLDKLKPNRGYKMKGVPLLLDQASLNEFCFYATTFPSNLATIDSRMIKPAYQINFNTDAPTCLVQSVNNDKMLLMGQRSGLCRLFDIRISRSLIQWQAHSTMTNIMKPKGVVSIFQEGEDEYLTVGCNQRNIKLWEKNQQNKLF